MEISYAQKRRAMKKYIVGVRQAALSVAWYAMMMYGSCV